tara:strand:- start:1588 stop:2973 length:1386 start_codon:yes stop_codon:yes gene_type:complete
MSTIKVNKIEKRTGSTLTLGGACTAVTLACGATQTGFGRTGTVDWCTTAKTSPFTATSGDGFFVNTTSGAITVTLPASPSAGDIVAVKDYTGTAACNAITIGRNGSKIRGACSCVAINQNNGGAQLIYVDGTEGWQIFQCGSDDDIQATFIQATGGTVTTSGNFKIHSFTGDGTFAVSSVGNAAGGGDKVSYAVVAGGGGGSRGAGGGGGAGGFREGKCTSDPYTASPLDAGEGLQVSVTSFPITVGGAGAASPNCDSTGGSGGTSTFSSITSAGGGGGNMNKTNPPVSPVNGHGIPGGSGGGGGSGSATGPARPVSGGSGNTPPVSPPQGNNGGGGSAVDNTGSGGGGGATAAGLIGGPGAPSPGVCGVGGNGGAGATTVITGSPVAYAGGGGGGSGNRPAGSSGGTGGGGNGGFGPNTNATAGGTNTGGGGGGGGYSCASLGQAAGGSGVVIIRYKFQN